METQRVSDERDDTIQMTAAKIEELELQTIETKTELTEKKTVLEALLTSLEEEKKTQAAALTAAKKKLNLAADEVLQKRRKVEALRKEENEELADLDAEEARYRDMLQALSESKEKLRHEIQEMQVCLIRSSACTLTLPSLPSV